jgi:hypothetical protein
MRLCRKSSGLQLVIEPHAACPPAEGIVTAILQVAVRGWPCFSAKGVPISETLLKTPE